MTEIYFDGSEAMAIKIGWELWDKPHDFKLCFWSGYWRPTSINMEDVLAWTEGD